MLFDEIIKHLDEDDVLTEKEYSQLEEFVPTPLSGISIYH